MAEIEHFVNPDKRQTFSKFSKVADLQLAFYSACNQMEGKPPQLMRLGDAVKSVSSILVLVLVSFNFCLVKGNILWKFRCIDPDYSTKIS